jgi:dTDP-4-amino-4,6-dideoxygalactose transaminase
VQLDKLKIDLEKREKVRQNYIKYLSGIKDVDIPFKDYHYFTSNYIFPVVLKKEIKIERDYIRNELLKAGIQTSVHYPAVHRFNIYKKFYRKLPNTDYVSDNLISFPMYSSLSKDKIKFVVQKFKNILYNV